MTSENLRLRELIILSRRERAGRRIQFHPTATVIQGPNKTGKSAILKSIVEALGADSPVVDDRWAAAKVSLLLRFTVGQRDYTVFRDVDDFVIEDESTRSSEVHKGVSSGFGPAFAKLVDFQFVLPNRETGAPTTPPPPFYLLPYYIDQDAGWAKPWTSFGSLGQFSGWRREAAEYHAGIRSNEYYTVKAQRDRLTVELTAPMGRITAIRALESRLEAQLRRVDFNIDIDAFKAEVATLVDEGRKVHEAEERHRHKVTELTQHLANVEVQRRLVSRTRDELKGDLKSAVDLPDTVSCPLCGADYNNDFAARFEVARDIGQCDALAAELDDEWRSLRRRLESASTDLESVRERSNFLRSLVETKQEQLTLREVIQAEGRRELRRNLATERSETEAEIARLRVGIQKLSDELAALSERSKRTDIMKVYRRKFEEHANALSMLPLPERVWKSVAPIASGTGSEAPRAVLAYTLAMVFLAYEFGGSASAPMLVDSPNQQDQDDVRLDAMLRLLCAGRPPGCQLVVGFREDLGVDFGGSKITLNKGSPLLRKQDYGELSEVLRPYFAKVHRQQALF